MKILVLFESKNDSIKTASLETVGAVSSFGEVHGAIVGPCADTSVASSSGVAKVFHLQHPALEKFAPEAHASALKTLVEKEGYDWVFGAATVYGKDLLPRLAASLNVAMASDVVAIEQNGEDFTFSRPVYAGKVIQKVKITGKKPGIASFRPNVFPAPAASGSAEVATVDGLNPVSFSEVKETKQGEGSASVDLSEAQTVISGGRSLKNGENFKLLHDLAAILPNSAVGASRAAVDAGYVPHNMQVGQTGKTVSPQLYLAFGISGAIQHLAGMRSSKIIVAINTDENAPIFQKADYGIVGDLFEIAPLMAKELKEALG